MAKVSEEMDKVIKDFVDVIPSVSAHTERQDNPHSVTAEQLGLSKFKNVTADAGELNILDGAKISTGELNFLNGTSSSVQAQLDTKADASHTHEKEYLPVFVSTKNTAPTTSTAPRLDLPNVFRYYTASGTEYLYKGKEKTQGGVKYLWEKTVLQDVNVSGADINTLEGIEGNIQALLDEKQDKLTENNYELVESIYVGYTKVPSDAVFESGNTYYYKYVGNNRSSMIPLTADDGSGSGADYCIGDSMFLSSGVTMYSNSANCFFYSSNPSQTIAYFGKPGLYRLFYENSGWFYNGSPVSLDDVAIFMIGTTPEEGIYLEFEIISIDKCYTFSDTGISSLTRDSYENGELYNFKELYVIVSGKTTSYSQLGIFFYDTNNYTIGLTLQQVSSSDVSRTICYNLYQNKGFYFLNFTPFLSVSSSPSEGDAVYVCRKDLFEYTDDRPIRKFELRASLAPQSTISIYGVRE